MNIDDHALENVCNKIFEATNKGYMSWELIQLENKIIGFVNYKLYFLKDRPLPEGMSIK